MLPPPDHVDAIGVSVCIPAYNEEALIEGTIREAASVLSQVPGQHEIVVVDDGSTDGTWHRIMELDGEIPELRPLRHPTNRGNPAAQRTLVRAARGEYVFHIGADAEWPMTALIPMLETMDEGYDIVIGVRSRSSYSFFRRWMSRAFNRGVQLLWGADFGDLGSLKLARSSLWKRLPAHFDSAFIHAERLLVARYNGARIAQVPVEHRTRTAGSSSYATFPQGWRALCDMVRFRLSGGSRVQVSDDE